MRSLFSSNVAMVLVLDKYPDVTYNVNGDASHAALLIGYDDEAQEFQLKNSWGENTYRRFAYDNITGGSIETAGVILDVASPLVRFSVGDDPQAFVGRWIFTAGRQAGDLDIYLSPVNPASKRIGTFFSSDGTTYRVNGFADRGTLLFFIDPTRPNLPTTLFNVGYQFTAYLFDDNRTMMAGDLTLPDGSAIAWVYCAQGPGATDNARLQPRQSHGPKACSFRGLAYRFGERNWSPAAEKFQ